MKKIFTLLLCCVAFAANAQVRSISGTVVSGEDGNPVAGVMVLVNGTNTYANTGMDGRYTISAEQGSSLSFNLLGYVAQNVTVGTSSTLDVILQTDATMIEELVVIGYGVQRKKLVTGATIQVSGDDVAKLNTVNVLGALQSQTPGVNIVQNSGMPGEGFKVMVRGMGTMGDAAPLYVVDGVPGGDINLLNPADIESIDVLKDAASAAIYGSRAANGVILVTTKQGRAGKMQVSLDAYYGIQNVYRMPQMLDAQQYATIMNEARMMDGLAPYDFSKEVYGDDPANHWQSIENGSWKGTNWLDESRNVNAPVQNYTLNMAGGTEQSVFSIGFGYTNQEGILGKPVQPKWSRYSARINSEHTLVKGKSFDIVKFGENLVYAYTERPGAIRIGDQYWNDIRQMMTMAPFLPMLNDDGDDYHYAIPWEVRQANPIAQTYYRAQNLSKNHRLRTNAYLTIQPIKGLIFRSNFGYNYSSNSYRSFSPLFSLASTTSNTLESVSQSMGMGASLSWENTLTYDFDVNDHHFTALLGQSIEKSGMGESLNAANGNPMFHDLEHAYIANAPLTSMNTATSMGGSPWGMGRLASFFGRVSWDYKDRYMATVVLRADGSSNFKRGNRWGYFPSVSAGWVITEEDFMEPLRNAMDFLKVRASWGQNGNQNIRAFQYLSPISTGPRYPFGTDKTDPAIGAYPEILPNEDVSWETSEQIDFGIDARFLRSRLGFTFDYYVKNTKDWLVTAPQLASYGTGAPSINGGDIRNSGVEVAFNWNDNVGEFTYGANVNFTFNKNEVTRLANAEGIIHGPNDVLMNRSEESFRAQVGFPIGFFYGFSTAGIFQSADAVANYTGAKLPDAREGDVIWVDHNGDGKIDSADKHMIGDPRPDFNLGINLNAEYKGFDLNVTMTGVFGNQIMKSYRSWPDNPKDNFTTDIFDRWHGEGTSNRFPRLSSQAHTNRQWVSDLYIENGDYLRMQNITLGYDFGEILNTGFLSQARIYVTAQNLFTITGYSGMDPEVGYGFGDDYGWASGIDLGFYPQPRTWIFGVNLKF
ncbi:MAG: TonB-dependent receptor [Alistipes sp.]|jgi:TonB-linked SusC/RagA family outer membrane protein|nr:TonB-dependent receptor [Alistipes sp.]